MKIKLLKNYFVEIWLLFVSAIAVTILVLSLFLYKSFELSTIDTINRLNHDFLRESARTNEYVRRMIRISGMELFLEPSIRRLMYDRELTNFEVITGIRRIDSIRSMGRFIHSIYVFNAETNYVYATSDHTSNKLNDFEDKEIFSLLYKDDDPRMMIPIARYAVINNRKVPVHTFIFSDSNPARDLKGALIINLTLDWLDEIVEHSESEFFIIDLEGTVIYNPDSNYFLQNFSEKMFVKRVINSNESNGVFVETIDNIRCLVLFTADSNHYFLRIFPYDTIMANLKRMQRVTFFSFFIVLFLGAMVAFFLSHRLYRPIRNILKSIGTFGFRETLSDKNDLGYITTSIESMIARTNTLEASSQAQMAILRKEVIKELLLGNIFSNEGISELFIEYGIGFQANLKFSMIAVIQTPELTAFFTDFNNQNNDKLQKFNMCTVYVSDIAVCLFQGSSAAAEKFLIRQLKKTGTRLISYNDNIMGAEKLAESFDQLKDILRFSFLYDYGHVVLSSERNSRSSGFEYPTEIEKQIIQLARADEIDRAKDMFQNFLQQVSAYRYDYFRFSIRRLYISLQVLIRELQHNKTLTNKISGIEDIESYPGFEGLAGYPSTIDEIIIPFSKLFNQIRYIIEEARAIRHREIAELVKNIINTSYADPNLSLQYIADRLGFSVSYISKVFKEVYSVSVADAINDYRIEIAKTLLINETMPAREIAIIIGITNENYFYTLFRKKIGLAPAAFRRANAADIIL